MSAVMVSVKAAVDYPVKHPTTGAPIAKDQFRDHVWSSALQKMINGGEVEREVRSAGFKEIAVNSGESFAPGVAKIAAPVEESAAEQPRAERGKRSGKRQ